MQMTKRLAAFVTAIVAAMTAATVALAALPDVPHHRHFVVQQDHWTQIGPRVCDDPSLYERFKRFHWNVHAGATGLTNGTGADIVGRPCSFVAPR